MHDMLVFNILMCLAAFSQAKLHNRVHIVPGVGCGVTNPIVRPKSLKPGSDFRCVLTTSIVERELFREKCLDAWLSGCREAVPSVSLEDKSGWAAFSNEVFRTNAADFGAHLAIDGLLTPSAGAGSTGFFLKQKDMVDGWLQVTLDKAHYVSGILIELRRDCCDDRNSFLEVRVGNVDTTELPKAPLQVNEICATGDGTYSQTMTYNCSRPLPGRHVTLQKKDVVENSNWAFSVNEMEVYVPVF